MDDLLMDFLTETHESLSDLDVALVRLEMTPFRPLIPRVDEYDLFVALQAPARLSDCRGQQVSKQIWRAVQKDRGSMFCPCCIVPRRRCP